MAILHVALLSHLMVFHFRPLNIFRTATTTQTVESPVKINQEMIQEVFRRQA